VVVLLARLMGVRVRVGHAVVLVFVLVIGVLVVV
jgi:hypothetical protein